MITPLKIAVLTNAYPPKQVGGAARIAAVQVDMLRQAGHEVRVWCPPVSWFSRAPWYRLLAHLRDLGPAAELVTDILIWKPDVLLTHNLTGCGFGTPYEIQKTGVRWIHMLHDIQLFEPSGELYRLRPVTFWQLGWAFLRHRVFHLPHVLLSPTRWLIEQHQRRFLFTHSKIKTDTDICILPNPGPVAERCSRGVQTPFRLLFVGRVSPAKGSRMLLQIMKVMHRSCELHVVGDGPDIALLRDSGLPIVFHGPLDTEGVLAVMKQVHALLVPSQIHENQPTVILEAASVNLPVIAARRGGIPETLGEAAAEMMCSHDHVAGWCKTIERLMDSGVYQHQMHLMEHLTEAHDPEAYAQRFLSLFKSNL